MATNTYSLLQSLQQDFNEINAENQRLREAPRHAYCSLYYWKEQAIFYQAERDYYQDQGAEKNGAD